MRIKTINVPFVFDVEAGDHIVLLSMLYTASVSGIGHETAHKVAADAYGLLSRECVTAGIVTIGEVLEMQDFIDKMYNVR